MPTNPPHLSTDITDADRAHQRRTFHVHAAVFACSMVLIGLVNLGTNAAAGIADDWRAWWSGLALVGWGFGLAIHGVVVRIAHRDASDVSDGGATANDRRSPLPS
jgi:hypothetical protein